MAARLAPTTTEVERTRQLRRQGLSLQEIARLTGSKTSTVYYYVKDIVVRVGDYRKELPVSLVHGTVIDIETTGVDPAKDEIITFGFLQGAPLRVLQRVEADATEFHGLLRETMVQLGAPCYAYNAAFEQTFLEAKLEAKVPIIDIFEPWMKQAEAAVKKYPKLDDLASVPQEYFGEEVVLSRDIPNVWQAYQKRKDMRCLSPIVRHNMEDLMQALYVLAHTKF